MQTIPKFSTSPNGDSHTVFWGDQVIGKIDFNITTLKWEYSRYSQYPAITSGATAAECLKVAEQDHALVHASNEPCLAEAGYVNSIRLVRATDMASLTGHINQAKADGIPTIIWLAGEDAPLWWSECLQASVMAAYKGRAHQ
ncbi:hypothetical protein N836_31515 [Leptolyngbya sp. Heron Island J]|uniref:hypothetical protein n=1 Tax=Leptolyngbya sp. Heron Island J TaxID=1385935 RepID=UPI0003B93D8C|nr:hypothetical protein [Leptolyngbya sp. Heron Island J]ESA38471.1 hypothetical protein N836_31515 [Leptolyngbya sp. Heron Island J]